MLTIGRYNTALSLPHTKIEELSIRHNRTAALLKLEYYDATLEDAQWLLEQNSIKEPALLRAIGAAYQLQQYEVCQRYLVVLKQKFPACVDQRDWVCRVCDRLMEQRFGKYDFANLWKESPSAQSPHLDLATYVSPIESRDTESRGRGLFATKSVKAGELLLCEKALSAIMPETYQFHKMGCFVVNRQETVLTTDPAAFAIRSDIVQKLTRNPSLRPSFERLYDGGYRDGKYNQQDDNLVPCVDA